MLSVGPLWAPTVRCACGPRDRRPSAVRPQRYAPKKGQGSFDLANLLGPIEELDDNYASWNTYASHTLLWGVLDHIPPIFGCKDFAEVVQQLLVGPNRPAVQQEVSSSKDGVHGSRAC